LIVDPPHAHVYPAQNVPAFTSMQSESV